MNDILIVVFSQSNAGVFKDTVPDGIDTCVINPLGDFVSLDAAQDKINEYKYVMFVHDGLRLDFDVIEHMKTLLDNNPQYGIVYGDYLQRINNANIPRLRRSYKISKKNKTHKMVPIFGSLISEELVPNFMSELLNAKSITVDAFVCEQFEKHIPYHTPKFMFQA